MQTQLNTLIDGVITALGALRADVNIWFAAQEKKKETDAVRLAELDRRKADLDEREKPIKDFEQIGAMRLEAEKLSNDARELMGKARDAETNFNNWARGERDKIAKDAAANVARTNELNSEFTELRNQEAAFAKEKEDWELKAAKGIVKLATQK